MSIRLLIFVILLMPGWIALLRYYIFDSFIIRNIEYGKGVRYRNVLDVYLPKPHNPAIHGKKQTKYLNGVPVVVFLSGGAWIIGYKLWSALMGREFARRGYVVIVPDYRNFPQGNIEDMLEDLREALRWTLCNCSMFGGDPNKIILSGQIAGAHICLCTLIELYEDHLKKELKKKSSNNSDNNNNENRKDKDNSQERNSSNNNFNRDSHNNGQSNNNSNNSIQKSPVSKTIPHINTATVLISSSFYLSESSPPESNNNLNNIRDNIFGLDQTSQSSQSPLSGTPSIANNYNNSLNNMSVNNTNQYYSSEIESINQNNGIWWDVDTPMNDDGQQQQQQQQLQQQQQQQSVSSPISLNYDYTNLPSSPSSLTNEKILKSNNTSMEVVWDNSFNSPKHQSNKNSQVIQPSPFNSFDNLEEIITPLRDNRRLSSPKSLPLEINLLGKKNFASDVINDTAKHNVEEFAHDLDITDIKLFIGISGPYNMVKLLQHLHFRGLDASILHLVFNSNVSHYSPVQRLSRLLKTQLTNVNKLWDEDENILKQTYNQFYSYLFNISQSTPATDLHFMSDDFASESGTFISLLIYYSF